VIAKLVKKSVYPVKSVILAELIIF